MFHRTHLSWLPVILMVLVSCGPDTIFVRPYLGTPSHHVENGHNLLARGKIADADAEFNRAKQLDDRYVPAYVGLAMVKGRQGDVEGGLAIIRQARSIAVTPEDLAAVDQCENELQKMESNPKE